MEAVELGTFMVAACMAVAAFEHPSSALHRALPDAFTRRGLVGAAMGLTAIAIVYSPMGRRSGAHFNPCVTLTFYRLGKVRAVDAALYVLAQFIGGAAGVGLSAWLLGAVIADPAVAYAVTVPGPEGTTAAFAAELAISFGLMAAVLVVSNTPRLAGFTGLTAGVLVATYVTVEAPLSGMSMNPARTLASAVFAFRWDAAWIYFVAPALGMLGAAEAYLRLGNVVRCAKLHHDARTRCIFCAPHHVPSTTEVRDVRQPL